MRILNLHGFLGAADNKNYKALCGLIAPEQIVSPKLDYLHTAPDDLLRQLTETAADPDFIFVGQSLGGLYADLLSRRMNRLCILTNPCYFPHTLSLIADEGMPSEYLARYRELAPSGINPLSVVLCGDADTLITGNLERSRTLSEHVTSVPGGHSSIENLADHLAEALRTLKTITEDEAHA